MGNANKYPGDNSSLLVEQSLLNVPTADGEWGYVEFYIRLDCILWLYIVTWSASKTSAENCTNAQIGPLVVNSIAVGVVGLLGCIEGEWG